MRNYIVAFFMLTFLFAGFSQERVAETYTFTLDEAIGFAIENNYKAINASHDIEAAKKQKWETIAAGLPQVNGNVSYQNQLKQPVSLIPAEFFGGDAGTFQEVVFSPPQSASATATLTQQIFNGSYIVGVQATKTFLDFSANAKEKTSLDITKDVTQAYGNVLLNVEAIAILEKNKENLEKTLFESQKIFENGLGDEESVEQLQITLSTVENQLKNVKRLSVITLQMLNITMGIDMDAPTRLTDNLDDLAESQIDFDLIESDLSIENNVDYKMVLNLNEQRFLEHKLARSAALPSLNAFVNYGTSGFGDKFEFFSSDQQWFDSSIFGLELNVPIFSSFKRQASTARAKIEMEKAKTQLEETEQLIRLQAAQAKSEYTFSIEHYQTTKANVNLAERIANKNEIKFTEGLATSFELRQAQTQLYNSQQEYLESMVQVINKRTDLQTILNNN